MERPPTSPLLRLTAIATSVKWTRLKVRSLRGIHSDLGILLDIAADRGDFGDALNRRDLIPEIPVLHRAQFGEVAVGGVERIHKRP